MKICDSEKLKDDIRQSFRGYLDEFKIDALCNVIDRNSIDAREKVENPVAFYPGKEGDIR